MDNHTTDMTTDIDVCDATVSQWVDLRHPLSRKPLKRAKREMLKSSTNPTEGHNKTGITEVLADSTEEHNKREVEALVPGDIVVISRGDIQHWVVYLDLCFQSSIVDDIERHVIQLEDGTGTTGDETVVHMTRAEVCENGSSNHVSSSKPQRPVNVRIKNFYEVADKSKAARSNILDGERKPLPRREIMKRVANSLFEEDLWFKDSKQFALWCRYGDGTKTPPGSFSVRVEEIITAILTFVRNIVGFIFRVCRT